MKKILEAIKRFLLWVKKPLALIKKAWLWVSILVVKREWVFTFPAAVFATIAFLLHSVLVTIIFFIWVITIICNTNEEK
jgi:hypothetical protein